jgi:hypothetical protein
MPKLRPLDFDKIKAGDKKETRRAIKDLLMLTPRGADQNLRGNAYFKFECHPGKEAILKTHDEYVTAVENADDGIVRSYSFGWHHNRKSSWWGYTDEQLYWIAKAAGCKGTWINESDFRSVLRDLFPDVYFNYRSAKLTRGSRRLANRLGDPWRKAIAGGNLGDLAFTCTVETPYIESERYSGPTTQTSMEMSFAAKTEAEAEMMLRTMFGHAVHRTERVGFTAWQAAEPATILAKNVEQGRKLASARRKALQQIEQLQQFINNIDTLDEAVQMYSMTICE